MTSETHTIEYKDFSKDSTPDKKRIIGKLFAEISAFANTEGGTVIVGAQDQSLTENEQPDCVYAWLENDTLTNLINMISDNLLVFHSRREGNLVYIQVKMSDDVIAAARDSTGVNKGDCFIRENDKTVKATGNKLTKLVKKKSISVDTRLKQLRRIVHYKFQTGENHAENINIFDSLYVTVENDEPYIQTVFDNLVMYEFIFGLKFPRSKYSTLQLNLSLIAQFVSDKSRRTASLAFEALMKSEHNREMFFKAHKDEMVISEHLKLYLLEYSHLF